jgi:hypothetical protein
MIKTLFIAASMTSVLLAYGGASVAMAAEAQHALNIGFVLYTKGDAPGTLNARWTYQNIYSGKGVATGGPKEGYAGRCEPPRQSRRLRYVSYAAWSNSES